MLHSAPNVACMRLKVGDSARIRRYPESFTLKNMSLDTLALNLAVAAQDTGTYRRVVTAFDYLLDLPAKSR